MIQDLKPLLGKLSLFAKKQMGFHRPPKLFLKQDPENSSKALGRTAHYDPQEESVTLYVTSRHPKDILRSFAHELVHHTQNLRGDLSPEKIGQMSKNYAQDNDHMRNMEKEAYLQGNMCFRDWEDTIEDKDKILIKLAESKFLKENETMTTKITKEFLKKAIRKLLKEQVTIDPSSKPETGTTKTMDVGPGLPDTVEPDLEISAFEDAIKNELARGASEAELRAILDDAIATAPKDSEDIYRDKQDDGQGRSTFPEDEFEDQTAVSNEVKESSKMPGAPGHYCVHHGGVQHEGKIVAAEAIQHVEPDENGSISHYDMKLPDGTILEDVAAEDIQITNATLESSHGSGKRHHKPMKKKIKEDDTPDNVKDNTKPGEKANKLDFAPKASRDKKNKEDGYTDPTPNNESKIQTPEQENTLYEQRFTPKNNRLFEKLLKEWTK